MLTPEGSQQDKPGKRKKQEEKSPVSYDYTVSATYMSLHNKIERAVFTVSTPSMNTALIHAYSKLIVDYRHDLKFTVEFRISLNQEDFDHDVQR